MATFRKRGTRYEAAIAKRGVRVSRTFHRLTDARAWALETEIAIERGDYGREDMRLRDLMDRYEREVSRHKRSADNERKRLTAMGRWQIADLWLHDIDAQVIGQWRDWRGQSVAPATVQRDWNLLSAIFHRAIAWGLLDKSPMTHVPRPPETAPRTRRPTDDEIERLLLVAAYTEPPGTLQQRVACAMLFSIETAMRAGEIAGIRPEYDHGRYVHLPQTKTVPRDVPLSAEARRLLDLVGRDFKVTARQIDTTFRRMRDRAGIEDLHFHDMRREALTRLARKVDPLSLAKISGHTDLKILLSVYYRPDPGDLADMI